MAGTPDNHTIKLLQEMRREMQEGFDAISGRFDGVDARFDEVDARIDGVAHIMTLMAGHSHDLDTRVEMLEARLKPEV
ncbi:hypothetical protein SAMN05443999_101204 [Roseovarius azorensis]|uniref:Uncharacterized protein n=1 Tax=Roseovarius azorensis TaxID=1287727 RepID=A0A1H7G1N7_9RHOB|nr:hypothetical protein [Roseovarius azorensis]SEK31964.1 hypothetical protein SAMN05443999_101204 [Roseovarius azorensis]